MTGSSLVQESQKFEIQAYRAPKDPRTLKHSHVAFSGSPRRHPNHEEKLILVADPYSADTFYYEFDKEDIAFAEELPSLVSPDGDSSTMVRIWIKKGSIGIRCIPFVVEDTRR